MTRNWAMRIAARVLPLRMKTLLRAIISPSRSSVAQPMPQQVEAVQTPVDQSEPATLVSAAPAALPPIPATPEAVEDYWSANNVTEHREFLDEGASLADFHWRNAQYFRYIDLMPVTGADNLHVLDFGCGPGYDLVGFVTQSKPARLVGVDVSKSSLFEASRRLALHGSSPN